MDAFLPFVGTKADKSTIRQATVYRLHLNECRPKRVMMPCLMNISRALVALKDGCIQLIVATGLSECRLKTSCLSVVLC